MRTLRHLLSYIFFASTLFSCTVKEHFHFNDDLSGHYSFEFDYKAILDLDSSGSANNEMDKGFIEMEDELEQIEGISNIIILSDNEQGKVFISYDFAGIEALNQANYNKGADQYDKVFVLNGKKLSFSTDFSSQLDEYKEDGMDDKELLENINSFLDYTMTFSFDRPFKLIEQHHFNLLDDQSLEFILSSESAAEPSSFNIKLK
jgi:hypothetical protein